MKLTELRPMIWTENPDETVRFNRDVLGFTCGVINEDWGWASFEKDNVGIMAAKPNEHSDYNMVGFTGSFYFNTGKVDALWNELKGKAKICYAIDDFENGMREFAVYDNNGYLLQFGQEI